MKCPNCGFEQADGLLECQKCQIIFSKWQEREARKKTDASTKIIFDKDTKDILVTKITTTDSQQKKEIPLTDDQYAQFKSLIAQGKNWQDAVKIIFGVQK